MIFKTNYFFAFALDADGFLGVEAAAGACFVSSSSTSKISVDPPGTIGGLP
jgi:glycerate-2-kinase